MQTSVTWLLRIGVAISLVLVVTGAALYLPYHANDIIQYSVFRGEPSQASSVVGILSAAPTLSPLALIELGILVLIVTQMIRIAMVAWHFYRMRDYKFTIISSFVFLAVIGISFGIF